MSSSRFGTWTVGRPFPATKGLALHDGSSDGAVNISITDLNSLNPVGNFFCVQGMKAPGKTEVGLIRNRKRVLKIAGFNHAQDGSKAFGTEKPAPPDSLRG